MRRAWTIAVMTAGLLAGVAAAQPQPKARPAVRTPDCTTSGCHAEQINHKFLHGPTAVSACDMCHTSTDVTAHTFKLRAQGKDLCTFCHINIAGGGAVSHKPFADGDCLKCHDPHGGETRTNLKFADVNGLCTSCHNVLEGHSSVHKAVTDGQCTACHKAHTADHAKLLVQPTPTLCITCHEPVKHQIDTAKFVHKPLTEGDCLRCHTPHASDTTHQLKAEPARLCGDCHKEVLEQARRASTPHSAVTDGEACLNCHKPHGSEHASLMRDEPVATCVACHKEGPKLAAAVKDQNPARPVFAAPPPKEGEPAKPKTMARGVPELLTKGLNPHGPVAEGKCGACHDVHGGSRADLLKANFSGQVQQKFTEGNFELCFSCHDPKLLASPTTSDATNFRDGERNLHHLHVTVRGRPCTACHSVHASRVEQQICDSVTFGNWELPINFKVIENGASCAPGCHKAQTYTRTAVKIPVKGSTLGTAPAGPGE